MKKPLSIVISAYDAQDFIGECLDSIENQTYFTNFDDYEILLGVDSCNNTIDTLLKNRHKYRNLRLFWIDKNSGPYLVFNTLINISKYDIITIFGADDIMKPDHIESNMSILKENSFVKSKTSNFVHPNKNNIIKTYNPCGLIFFHKKNFLNLNGFEPWRCGADTDLNKRFLMDNILQIYNKISTSLRRIHNKSLTVSGKYDRKSEYRKNILNIIKSRKKSKLDQYSIYKNIIEL